MGHIFATSRVFNIPGWSRAQKCQCYIYINVHIVQIDYYFSKIGNANTKRIVIKVYN